MGEQVKEIYNWARRRKIMAALFVALTLLVGIMIGSVVSGRVGGSEEHGICGNERDAVGGARSDSVV